MNNIIIIAYLICLLIIFIPLYIYRGTCPDEKLYRHMNIEKHVYNYLNILSYVLIGISVFLIISSPYTNTAIYWFALWSIISLHVVHYMYLYDLLYLKKCNKLLLLLYTMILSFQLLCSYYINPISGILLAPVLVWYSYLLIQFKEN